MNKRLNIGLMISHLNNDFAGAVCDGAISAAKEIDANLFIMPGRYIEGVYVDKERTTFEYQYNTLFSYAFPEDIDILIVLIGALASSLSADRKIEFLKQFGDIPIITIACELDGYPYISFDNKSGITQCVEHLIKEHGCRKIGFVSGPPTNEDARMRLSAYKETLENNGIEYSEDRVVYGRFSPYSEKVTNELLDRCPDLEAIAFANDAMACGAYKVFAERGLEIGRDILITGFDDSPDAAIQNPPLTTARADASELGYYAVLECKHYSETKTITSRHISSSFVPRRSCGGKAEDSYSSNDGNIYSFNGKICMTAEEVTEALCGYLFKDADSNKELMEARPLFEDYISNIFSMIYAEGLGRVIVTDKLIEYIPTRFEEIFRPDKFGYSLNEKICNFIDYLGTRFTMETNPPEARPVVSRTFIGLYQIVTRAVAKSGKKEIDDIDFLHWQMNSITKDMLLFDSYDDEGYGTVTDKLMRLDMGSSYLFVFPEPVSHGQDEKWTPPSEVLLKAYHIDDKNTVVPQRKQMVSIRNLFRNEFLPEDRRVTMVLSTIFLHKDHYGLVLCELEPKHFHYIPPLISQLCAAMKLIKLMQDKEVIRLELEQSLSKIQESNQLLDAISKIDELTQVYNRRGFFTLAEARIKDHSSKGKNAVIVFADLDSLKIINDDFSHEDGDFAIKSSAKILSQTFRGTDIIGRIGGDEFCVLAMVDNISTEDISDFVKKRINAATDALNESHDKPYIVHLSVGVYSFVCSEDISLPKILSQADNLLYEEKKNKKSILR